jgi:DNA polymerase III delta subunit
MPKSCYLICGEDDFQIAVEARKIVDRLVSPENRTFGLEVIDGRVETVDESLRAIRQCIEAMTMDGLFGGGNKLIWLREPAFLSNDRVAKSEAVKTLMPDLTAKIKGGLPEGQSLLVTTGKINRASAFFKAFASGGEVTDFGNGLKPRQCEARARQLLDAWLPQVDLTMDNAVKQQFVARVGTDSRQIVSELEKLKCYCGDRLAATADDVQAIVSGGRITEIWDFLDAFGKRQTAALIQQLRIQFTQSESPIRLANSLESKTTELMIVREALDRKWATPGGYAGLNWTSLPPDIAAWFDSQESDFRKLPSFRITKAVDQAGCWSLRELRAARHLLLELREKLVSSSLPQEWLMEMYLIRALGQKPARGCHIRIRT